MEKIIAAAYKVKPEFEVKRNSYTYKNGTKEMDDIYNCRIGRHHAEILQMFGKEINTHSDGFYTSHGRFVDRKEAAKIALECRQIDKLKYWPDMLDSSDIY